MTIIKRKDKDGDYLTPQHNLVKSWYFELHEEEEANLAHALALVAEKNGMDANDLMHLYPAILRMMKSDITWASNINLKKK